MSGDSAPRRVVPDVNVLLQAIIGPGGPSMQLFHAAWDRKIEFVRSHGLIAELQATLAKPRLRERYPIVVAAGAEHVEEFKVLATPVADVPEVFAYARDPDDAYLVDLAVAADAQVITTSDNDLLDLMGDTPDGHDFRRRFPRIEILTPPELLQLLRSEGSGK